LATDSHYQCERHCPTRVKAALEEHRGNQSVVSIGLNALMLYPDRPFALGTLYGYAANPETGERERFVISDPADLDQEFVYAKERRLLEEVKAELQQGRRVQIFAVYSQKRDVTQRLKGILSREGIRVEVLTTAVPPQAREAWYERPVRSEILDAGLNSLPYSYFVIGCR
jgi:hypothetical protein